MVSEMMIDISATMCIISTQIKPICQDNLFNTEEAVPLSRSLVFRRGFFLLHSYCTGPSSKNPTEIIRIFNKETL